MRLFRAFFVFSSTLFFNNISQAKSDSLRLYEFIEKGREMQAVGKFEKSANFFITVQKTGKKLGYEELAFEASVDLANLYLITGEPKKSGEIFSNLKSDKSYSPRIRCKFHHRKAFYFNQTGNLDSSLFHLESALVIAKEQNFEYEKGTIYNEWGNIFEKKRDYDHAVRKYSKAAQIFPKESFDYANTSFNLGRTYYHQQDYDSAVHILSSLTQGIHGKDWHNIYAPANFFLAMSYFELGDSLLGYKSLAIHRLSEIKLRQQTFDEQYQELKVAYETDQKELEIKRQENIIKSGEIQMNRLIIFIISLALLLGALSALVYIIRKKNRRLNKLAKENEFLLGEANHRIKNNLQLIISLLAREINKSEKLGEIDALRVVASKIESISTLHQQLYLNEEKSEINLRNYLLALCENLKPLYTTRDIHLNVDVAEDLAIKVSQSIYVGLLVNELIINSIKHAFNGKNQEKKISMTVNTKSGKKIELIYEDNGYGIKDNKSPKLVVSLSKQLKSEYKFEGNKGFKYSMKFKAA